MQQRRESWQQVREELRQEILEDDVFESETDDLAEQPTSATIRSLRSVQEWKDEVDKDTAAALQEAKDEIEQARADAEQARAALQEGLRTRLEKAIGRPSDMEAEDVCELVSLRRALADATKLCHKLEKELAEAYQLVADSVHTYEALASRTKQQVEAQERRILELEAENGDKADEGQKA